MNSPTSSSNPHYRAVWLFALLGILTPLTVLADAKALFKEGYDLLQAGKASQAVSKFEEGLREQPNDAQANFYLAEAYRKLGKNATAKMYYEKSLKLDPNSKVAAQAKQQLARKTTASGQSAGTAKVVIDSRYAINGDEVQDIQTGLKWKRCGLGQQWNGSTCLGYPTLMSWSEAIQHEKGGWRVPTKAEVDTIVDASRDGPKYNKKVFPNADRNAAHYWIVNGLNQNGKEYYYIAFISFSSGGIDHAGFIETDGRYRIFPHYSQQTSYLRLVRSMNDSKTATPQSYRPTPAVTPPPRPAAAAVRDERCFASARVRSSSISPMGDLNVQIEVVPEYCERGCYGTVSYQILARGSATSRRDIRGQNPEFDLSGVINWESHNGRTVTVNDTSNYAMLCNPGMLCSVKKESIGTPMGMSDAVTCYAR